MWDERTLDRLRIALLERLPPADVAALESDDLAAILTTTFLGAQPFHVEPGDVVVARAPAALIDLLTVKRLGDDLVALFPHNRVAIVPADLELERIGDDGEEIGDVPI